MSDLGVYPDVRTILIRTTEAGSCLRKRQHNIRGVKDGHGSPISPLESHIYPIRGWTSHYHIEQWFKTGHEYTPVEIVPTDIIQRCRVDVAMLPTVALQAKHDWDNFIKWTQKTKIPLGLDQLIGTEHNMTMPLTAPSGSPFTYLQRCDVDVLLKGNIIDFKSGSKSYLSKNKWQLGSYRRIARFHKLHEQSPTGDFNLYNVFLGDDEPEEQLHDPKKIAAQMTIFDSEMTKFLEADTLIRMDAKYEAPCTVGIYCAFCDWRHVCRGV